MEDTGQAPEAGPRRNSREVLEGVTAPTTRSISGNALERVAVERKPIQDFRPLSESLEWSLSNCFWATRGVRPFVEGDVPFLVNNSGWAAESAAATFLASCESTENLPSEIRVLEVGAGLGLFARQFLDAFRDSCETGGRDFYRRLRYFITDGSSRTVSQWRDKGLFEEHAGHVVMAHAQADTPAVVVDAAGTSHRLSDLQAVFANYILDSLPAAVVRKSDGVYEELIVRTHLSAQYAEEHRGPDSMSPAEIASLAMSSREEDLGRLLPVINYLEFETSYGPVGAAVLPLVRETFESIKEDGPLVVSHGAVKCLDACLALLGEKGFVLLNDYGATSREQVRGMAKVNRFGGSITVCIDFPFLEERLTRAGYEVSSPPGDAERPIHSRLVSKTRLDAAVEAFHERFSDQRYTRADELANQAVDHVQAGRHAEALECYKRAAGLCPRDWNILALAAQFLTQQLLRPEEALDVAREALAINPWYSAFLWNTLGNCLFCVGKHEEAHQAYLRALAIDDRDPQTYLNLAYVQAEFGNHGAALTSIARALQNDVGRRFEGALLQKQRQVLEGIAKRRETEAGRLAARNTAFAAFK